MSFTGAYTCDRCKKEITDNASVTVSYEGLGGLSHLKRSFDLCRDCFLTFLDWTKNSEPTKLGPVERIARREDSK